MELALLLLSQNIVSTDDRILIQVAIWQFALIDCLSSTALLGLTPEPALLLLAQYTDTIDSRSLSACDCINIAHINLLVWILP